MEVPEYGEYKAKLPFVGGGGGGCRLFLELYVKISIVLIIGRLRVIREKATGGSTVATSN